MSMETSLSVQNDAILKKAKWWIIIGYAYSMILNLFLVCGGELLLREAMENAGILTSLLKYAGTFLILWGMISLKKTHLSALKSFAKLMSLVLILDIISLVLWSLILIFQNDIVYFIRMLYDTILLFLKGYIGCMACSALMKNQLIAQKCKGYIILLYLLIFVTSIVIILPRVWCNWYRILFVIFDLLVPVFYIILYKNIFTNLMQISIDNTDEETSFSIRPTRIEIGFIISFVLCVICSFLGESII